MKTKFVSTKYMWDDYCVTMKGIWSEAFNTLRKFHKYTIFGMFIQFLYVIIICDAFFVIINLFVLVMLPIVFIYECTIYLFNKPYKFLIDNLALKRIINPVVEVLKKHFKIYK